MAKNVDLNKLKNEIDSRKSERNLVSSRLGENVGTGVMPRDTFLNGLIESWQTGRETVSSVLIKTIDNKLTDKRGGGSKLPISETAQLPPQQQLSQLRPNDQIDMSPERDEQLYRDMEMRRKQTLAESISNFKNTPTIGSPMQNNSNTNMPMQINEAYLTENVKNIVNNYLIENFGPVVEEAIKSTILEMYAVERIKEVLHENKDLIKTVVIETIREIQAKSKKAQ